MKRSSFFAIRSAGKLLECLRIQKVNAFEQLIQNHSNAEKTEDCIRDDGDNSRLLTYRCQLKKKKKIQHLA